MSNLIPVVYVGNKPQAFDNVAHSGKSWEGKGDVQHVTHAQARILVKYPDQWALVDESDRAAIDAPVSIQGQDEDGQAVAINPESLKKPIEKMSKAELMALAKETLGKTLDPLMPKKSMIYQVEEWKAEQGV